MVSDQQYRLVRAIKARPTNSREIVMINAGELMTFHRIDPRKGLVLSFHPRPGKILVIYVDPTEESAFLAAD